MIDPCTGAAQKECAVCRAAMNKALRNAGESVDGAAPTSDVAILSRMYEATRCGLQPGHGGQSGLVRFVEAGFVGCMRHGRTAGLRERESAVHEQVLAGMKEQQRQQDAEDAVGRQALATGDLTAACSHRYADSCTLLAWKNGCSSGDAGGCEKMGTMYWNGYERDGIAADMQRGLPFLDRACALEPGRCGNLGVVVMSTPAPLPPAASEPKIRSFFERACLASATSCAQSCAAYEATTLQMQGPHVRDRVAFTFSCYKRACSAGNATACGWDGRTNGWSRP